MICSDFNILTELLDKCPDLIWAIDKKYKLLACNRAFLDVFRTSSGVEAIIGNNVLNENFKPETINFWKSNFDKTLQGETINMDSKTEIQNEIHYYHNQLIPLKDSKSEVCGVIVYTKNIDYKIHLKNEIERREEELRLVTDHLPVLISHKNINMEYIYANNFYTEVFGLSKEEMVGKKLWEIIGNEAPSVWKEMILRLRKGETLGYINTIVDKNGASRSFRITHIPEYKGDVVNGFYTLGIDITELKQIQDDLREREFEINEIQQKTGLGLWTYDSLKEVYHWSKEMYNIFGMPVNSEPLKQCEIDQYIHHDDLSRYKESMLQAIKNGRPFVVELRILRPDGQTKTCICIGEVAIFQSEKVEKIRGTLQDVTERRKIVGELRESELRFKNMFSKHQSVMLLIEPNTGKILEANQAASRFYGYSVSELRLINIKEINMLSSKEIEEKCTMANEEVCNSFIFPHRLSSGEVRTVEVHSSPINIEGHRLLFSIIHDITKRVEAEKSLNESNEKYKILFDSSSDPIFIFDLKGNILAANQTATQEYGYSLSEFLGMSAYDLDTGEHQIHIHERVNSIIEQGSLMFETVHIRKDKTQLFSYINCRKIIYAGQEALFCDCRNINERKNIELILEEKKQQLQQLNNEKDKFFSIIAHDLRSPFTSVLGLVEILKLSFEDRNWEEIKEYVGMIEQAATKANELLDNLMQWARTQTGRISFNPCKYEFNDQINEIADFYIPIAAQKGILIQKVTPESVPIYADKEMVATILRNLITNAIKFTYTGGKITLMSEFNEKEVVIKVSDSGVGIPEAAIDKIFRIDNKYSTTGTNQEQGTGLGLVLCKEFVLKHGGRIWVESNLKKGSDFWFTIPNPE